MIVWVALAVFAGLGAATLAFRQARRAAAPTGNDTAALARALRRVPMGDRLAEVQRRTPAGTWEHDLAAEVLAARSEGARVAAVNLALAEVEHTLTEGAGWPRAGMRIALLAAGSLTVAAYISSGDLRGAVVVLAIGGASALACFEAGKSAARSAARQREAIDELIVALFGSAPPAGDAAPRHRAAGRPAADRPRPRRRFSGAGGAA